MWMGIHTDGLIGPYFFDITVKGQSYLEVAVELYGLMQADPTLARIQYFMPDDALLHYVFIVCGYLNHHFGDWIRERGVVEWPA